MGVSPHTGHFSVCERLLFVDLYKNMPDTLIQQRERTKEGPQSQATPATHDSRFLAAVVESSDDAIITKDLNGIITTWNAGAERIFGYSEEEVVGRPITILLPDDRQNEEPAILARL